ncbi:hypothetical protein SPBR_01868 [Sporothrix brasiliensis 5110]|uniref:Uncharacterized protein n=1 Tax=Sporothrix brasiliensis 5110 TaxID=1398154 RepID=A0A0C2EZL1_9PEZI|nr:uncharacterized protein SPBR_01868 [Sporothrix brasiliensis 5110]KIH91964.1 hypothetical protein SPBR_01868 [Sporothrix brasiliensis 5110]
MSSSSPDRINGDAQDTFNGPEDQSGPSPVLPPPAALPSGTNGSFPAGDPLSPLDFAGLSPEVVARLAHIVNNFRSLNGGSHATSLANGSSASPAPRSPAPAPSHPQNPSLVSTGEDSLLSLEKHLHEDTKRLLANAEQRIKKLNNEIEDHNDIMEDFRIDNRDLKDQVEASTLEIDSLHKHIAELGHVEQQLKIQIARQQTLEMHLQIEREGRKAVDDELAVSRRAHAGDLQKIDVERKQHAATTAVVEKQSEEIRELQQQLDAANKRVAARDRMLADAEAEKRTLQATVFDARHNIEETAAVFGEASLAFNTEVDRLMNTLLSMKLSATPRTVLPVQTPQPTLPPTPPRR